MQKNICPGYLGDMFFSTRRHCRLCPGGSVENIFLQETATTGPPQMCPGTVSSLVDVRSEWMIKAGLTISEYPVLAYDLLPLDGEVSQWETDGPCHFRQIFKCTTSTSCSYEVPNCF